MLKNLTKLLVSLSLASNAYAETTNNLVSQDFTTGWTNVGNSTHSSGTIAGHHNGTVESDAVSLNEQGINKESLNEGFTVTGGADIWFWNSYSQSVTQTIKTVDDNGNTLTQTRVINGIQNGFQTYTDQLIVGSNSQQDYDVNLKYSFSVPGTSGHYAADLKNPTLSVTYTYVAPLDTATQTELFAINETLSNDLDMYDATILTEEFKQDIGVNYVNDFTGEIYGTEPPVETFTESPGLDTYEMPEEIKEEDKTEVLDTNSFTESAEPSDEKTDAPLSQVSDSQDPQEPQSVGEEPSSLQAEQSSNEESSTETETSTEKEQTTEAAVDSKSNVSSDKKSISLAKSMDKIDAQVKDIGKNLQLKNLVKLKIMANNDVLQQYANITFYEPKKIYENQADIRDNRVLYADASLVSYTQNDPIFTKEKEIYNIRLQKQKLINEIKALTGN